MSEVVWQATLIVVLEAAGATVTPDRLVEDPQN